MRSVHVKLTVADKVVGFTFDLMYLQGGAIQVSDGPINYRVDGGDPADSTLAFTASDGDTFQLTGWDQVQNFRAVRTGVTNGAIRGVLNYSM